jgi:hypothetical protein
MGGIQIRFKQHHDGVSGQQYRVLPEAAIGLDGQN